MQSESYFNLNCVIIYEWYGKFRNRVIFRSIFNVEAQLSVLVCVLVLGKFTDLKVQASNLSLWYDVCQSSRLSQ